MNKFALTVAAGAVLTALLPVGAANAASTDATSSRGKIKVCVQNVADGAGTGIVNVAFDGPDQRYFAVSDDFCSAYRVRAGEYHFTTALSNGEDNETPCGDDDSTTFGATVVRNGFHYQATSPFNYVTNVERGETTTVIYRCSLNEQVDVVDGGAIDGRPPVG